MGLTPVMHRLHPRASLHNQVLEAELAELRCQLHSAQDAQRSTEAELRSKDQVGAYTPNPAYKPHRIAYQVASHSERTHSPAGAYRPVLPS